MSYKGSGKIRNWFEGAIKRLILAHFFEDFMRALMSHFEYKGKEVLTRF